MKTTFARDRYVLFFETDTCPGNRWRLWVPECVIFDADLHRGATRSKPEWARAGTTITVSGEAGDAEGCAARFWVDVVVRQTELQLRLKIENTGDRSWNDYANFAVCLSNEEAPEFMDDDGTRTFVASSDGTLVSLAQALPQAIAGRYDHLPTDDRKHAESYCHFPVGHRTDKDDLLEKFQVSTGFVARQSRDRKKTLAFSWDKPSRVDVNFNHMSCIHSHPSIGPLEPGAALRCSGLVVLSRANPLDTRQRVPEEFR